MEDLENTKVYLTDEQWAYVKLHEETRTREMNRHNAAIQDYLIKASPFLSKASSKEEKRNSFASYALIGLAKMSCGIAVDPKAAAKAAFQFADAMMVESEGGAA